MRFLKILIARTTGKRKLKGIEHKKGGFVRNRLFIILENLLIQQPEQ